jgi:hypothetical protein
VNGATHSVRGVYPKIDFESCTGEDDTTVLFGNTSVSRYEYTELPFERQFVDVRAERRRGCGNCRSMDASHGIP